MRRVSRTEPGIQAERGPLMLGFLAYQTIHEVTQGNIEVWTG